MSGKKIWRLITLIFILQSIPSFGGSLDGTYLMCNNIEGYYKIGNVMKFYVGISFENNKLRRTDYHIEKDEIFLNTTD